MSIDVRWLTNGEKEIYWIRDAVAETVNIYDSLEQVPKSIRHYAEKIKNPQVCEPDLARYFGVQKELYPDWPKPCGHPDFKGKNCIAEMCKYGGENKEWEKCQYFVVD